VMARSISGQGNAGSLGQNLDRIRKGDVLDFHEEFKNIASGSTAEAVINPFFRADRE